MKNKFILFILLITFLVENSHGMSQNDLNIDLFKAAEVNDYELAKKVINKGANVNHRGICSMTPIYYAAQNNSDKVANLLINNNVDLNLKASNGMTPLMISAHNGYLKVVKLLVEVGADLNITYNDFYNVSLRNATALDCAKYNDQYKVVKFLEDYKKRKRELIEKETGCPSVLAKMIEEY